MRHELGEDDVDDPEPGRAAGVVDNGAVDNGANGADGDGDEDGARARTHGSER